MLIPASSIYLAGNFIQVDNNYPIISPLTQKELYRAGETQLFDVDLAIKQADIAFKQWKKLSSLERGQYLLEIANYMLNNKHELANILHQEQGKPIQEAIAEIEYSSSYFTWFSHQGQNSYGKTLDSPCPNKSMYTVKKPIGVCAAITPFNFPSAMLARKLAPALAAGCPMIIKPASETPLSALMYGVIANNINLPKGLISILPASHEQSKKIGKILCESEIIKKLSFTGSTTTGKILMQQCASTLKRLSLELGGNAPFIVTEFANIDEAVKSAVSNKFRNAGQTCVCTNRFFIHQNIKDEFMHKFIVAVQQLKISPLINQKAIEKVDYLVKDAINKGAKVLIGGYIENENSLIYAPTILDNVNDSMDIYHQEIFGPIASIITYENLADVVDKANNTPYGLASYAYTNNIQQAYYLKNNLEYGMIGINTGAFSSHAFPFGGIKQSGYGKEGSIYGIDEYLTTIAVCEYHH